jgi:hypothetical protein
MNRRVGNSRLASLGPWLAATVLLSAGSSVNAEEETPAEYIKHTHVFRLILQHASHLKFVDSLTKDDDPQKCVIVVLGAPRGLEKIPGGLNGFLVRGGAILFATDHEASDAPLSLYGIQVSGDKVACKDRDRIYRDNQWCPYVHAVQKEPTGLFADLPDTPDGIERKGLATNSTSYLSLSDRGLWKVAGFSELATLPAGCAQLNENGGIARRFARELPFAVGGPVRGGDGRLLVMADHSVFINLMMQKTDNANARFALRVAKWLTESGKRKQILFIEDGVAQSGVKAEQLQALPIPPEIPKPSLDALIGVADQLLGDLEQEDVFNKVLVDKMPLRRLMRWLLILVTVLLVYYGFSRSRRGRHRLETAAPLLAIAVRRGKPNASAIELRHQSLVSGNNLWEPARVLARQFFESALGGALASPAAGRVRLPPFQVKRRGLRGWLMAQRVRRLWRFAHQPVPQPVTMRQFRKFARRVADLKDAVAQGRIRFSSTPQLSLAR